MKLINHKIIMKITNWYELWSILPAGITASTKYLHNISPTSSTLVQHWTICFVIAGMWHWLNSGLMLGQRECRVNVTCFMETHCAAGQGSDVTWKIIVYKICPPRAGITSDIVIHRLSDYAHGHLNPLPAGPDYIRFLSSFISTLNTRFFEHVKDKTWHQSARFQNRWPPFYQI